MNGKKLTQEQLDILNAKAEQMYMDGYSDEDIQSMADVYLEEFGSSMEGEPVNFTNGSQGPQDQQSQPSGQSGVPFVDNTPEYLKSPETVKAEEQRGFSLPEMSEEERQNMPQSVVGAIESGQMYQDIYAKNLEEYASNADQEIPKLDLQISELQRRLGTSKEDAPTLRKIEELAAKRSAYLLSRKADSESIDDYADIVNTYEELAPEDKKAFQPKVDAYQKKMEPIIQEAIDRQIPEYNYENMVVMDEAGEMVPDTKSADNYSKAVAKDLGIEDKKVTRLIAKRIEAMAEDVTFNKRVSEKMDTYGKVPAELKDKLDDFRTFTLNPIVTQKDKQIQQVFETSLKSAAEINAEYNAKISEARGQVQMEITRAKANGEIPNEKAKDILTRRQDQVTKNLQDERQALLDRINENYSNTILELEASAIQQQISEQLKFSKENNVDEVVAKFMNDNYRKAVENVSAEIASNRRESEGYNNNIFQTNYMNSLFNSLSGTAQSMGFEEYVPYFDQVAYLNTPAQREYGDGDDIGKFLASSANLAGSMTTQIPVQIAVSALTGGMGTIPQLLATGAVGWGMETATMTGNMYNQTLKEGGSITQARNNANEMYDAQVSNMYLYTLDGLPFVGKTLSRIGLSSKLATGATRLVIGGAIETATETAQEITQGAQEQAILTGGQYENYSDFITPDYAMKTFLEVAPTFLLGGGGQLMSMSRESKLGKRAAKEFTKEEVNDYIKASIGLSNAAPDVVKQVIYNTYLEEGYTFTAAMIEGLKANGTITSERATELGGMLKDQMNMSSTTKSLGLTPIEGLTYYAISDKYRQLKEQADAIENDDIAKGVIMDRANKFKQSASDFLADPKNGGSYVTVTTPNRPDAFLSAAEFKLFVEQDGVAEMIEDGKITYQSRNVDGVDNVVNDQLEKVAQSKGKKANQPQQQAEPQVTTKEGVQEEVIPVNEIGERRKKAESQIKRRDLFDGVGSFSRELGGSKVDAVPVSYSEINGIEFVQYANPQTGSVDVIVTGTSNNDFVGFYRLYENGKPTNKWSSKFENQSRNKENFKTMISGVQSLLPQDHQYTEKTSISTDGLRVWGQQLDRGYELQFDENGEIITNEVAINGDAIVNELGIDVNVGQFDNIIVSTKAEFDKVKAALLPYLSKFGLGENNIRWDGRNVKIDLPILKTQRENAVQEQTTSEVPVQSEAETGGKVDEKVQAEPQVTTQEGQEKVAPKTAKEKLKERSRKQTILKQIDNAKKAIARVAKGVEIIVATTPEHFEILGGDKGAYVNGKIYINLDKADFTTVAHEVFHGLLLHKGMSDAKARRLTENMLNTIRKTASQDLLARLDEFASMYVGEAAQFRSEESMAQLFGIIAESYAEMDGGAKSAVRQWLDGLIKMLGLEGMFPKDMSPLTASDKEVLNFLNTVARKVATGEEVTDQDVAVLKGQEDDRVFVKPTRRAQVVGAFSGQLEKMGISVGTTNEKTGKTKVTNFDIASALNEYYNKTYGKIAPNDFSKKAVDAVSEYATTEILFALSEFGENSGKGWYTEDYSKALETLSSLDKSIKNDPKIKEVATAIIAVASNSSDVYTNLTRLIYGLDGFKSNKSVPLDVGTGKGASSIAAGIKRYNQLLEKFENDPLKVAEFMQQIDTISNLKKKLLSEFKLGSYAQALNENLATNPEWNENETLPMSVLIFGPKIGAFYSNLSGLDGTPTIDRWCIRTIYRYKGDMRAKVSSKEMNAFMRDNKIEGVSESEALALAQEHAKLFNAILTGRGEYKGLEKSKRNEMLKPYRKGSQIWSKAEGVVNDIAEGADDTVSNKSQYGKDFRSFTKQVFEKARDMVEEKSGVKLSVSDVQAILWIYEKNLFGHLGVKQREDSTYSSSANSLVSKVNSGALTIDALKSGDLKALSVPDIETEGPMGDKFGSDVKSFKDGIDGRQKRSQEGIEVKSTKRPQVTQARKQRDAKWEQEAKDNLPDSNIKSKFLFEDKIKSGKWAMLTGENPNAKPATEEENKKFNEDAVKWLKKLGKNPIPIFGKYGGAENSFFVEDLRSDDAAAFAREFKQESVATNEGLILPNGDRYPRLKGEEEFNSEEDDYYSVINIKGEKIPFKVGYDVENLETALPEKIKEKLTDDGKGNYVFYHYSSEKRDVLKPFAGDAARNFTSKEEASALSSVGGVVMFYTDPNTKEAGVGNVKHTITIPKDKVYYFQTDRAGLYLKAKELFNEARPNQAFSPNYQAAWISKIMDEAGYEILVSDWKEGKLRAQTTKEVIVDESARNKAREEKAKQTTRKQKVAADVIKKGEEISDANEFLNCEFFCNKMIGAKSFKETFTKLDSKLLRVGVPYPMGKIEELRSVLMAGDILAFGDKTNPRHYSVYIEGDSTYEVEKWGDSPRIYSLSNTLREYESIAAVYREQTPRKQKPSIQEMIDFAKEEGISKKDLREFLKEEGYSEAAIKAALPRPQVRPPSARRITGQPKPKKVTVQEMAALKDQIRLEARAARGAVSFINKIRRDIQSAIEGLQKVGKLSTKQVNSITNKLNKVNLLNPIMRERFIDYMEKVYNNAEYAAKLSQARATRAKVKKKIKSEGTDAVLGSAAKVFAKVDPSMVDDIDAYNEVADKVLSGLSSSRVGGNFRSAFDIDGVLEYANKKIEEQDKAILNKLKETFEEITGTDPKDMTYAEMMSLLEVAEDDNALDDKNKQVRAVADAYFDLYSKSVSSMISEKVDPFTGEDIEVDPYQAELMKRLMSLDRNNFTTKELVQAVDILNNFVVNGKVGGVEKIVMGKEGLQSAQGLKGLTQRVFRFFSKKAGRIEMSGITSLSLLFERKFGGFSAGQKVMKAMGLQDLIKAASTVMKTVDVAIVNYYDKFGKTKPNGEEFNSVYNNAERGLYASLKRTVNGTAEEQAAEFKRMKNLWKESIEYHKNGTEKEKVIGEKMQKAYAKIAASSNSIAEVESKMDATNKKATEYWMDKFKGIKPSLDQVSLSMYNTVLEDDLFYTPITTKRKVGEDGIVDDNVGSFSALTGNSVVAPGKAGQLKQINRPATLSARYLSPDFDTNMANAYNAALMDISTAPYISKIKGFMNSKEGKALFGSQEDYKVIVKRVQDYINAKRGQKRFSTNKDFDRVIDLISKLGAARALGSITQPVKQTIPVAINAMIASNPANFLTASSLISGNKDAMKFLEESGYAIAIRGASARASIDSMDQQVSKLLSKTNGNVGKAMELVSGEWLLNNVLVKPDVFVAKVSWMSFYLQSLNKQGVKTGNIDWATHKINTEAAEYAQGMVDRSQNVSDSDLQGSYFTDPSTSMKFVRGMFPFMTFILNQKERMYSDIITISSLTSSKEDKEIAFRSLIGTLSEIASFSYISYYVSAATFSIAAAMIGYDEPEEEKKKRLANLWKGKVTSFTSDILSPFPPISDYAIMATINAAANATYGEDVVYEPRDKSLPEQLGVFGITASKALDLKKLLDMAYDGKFMKESFGKETEKTLTQGQQDSAKLASALLMMHLLGAPSDLGNVSGYIRKTIEKNSSSASSKAKSSKGSTKKKIKIPTFNRRRLSK